MTDQLSHIDEKGASKMVDISEKSVTTRQATAQAIITMQPNTLDKIMTGDLPKGDCIPVGKNSRNNGVKANP